MNNSLTKSEYITRSRAFDEKHSVSLLNPLSKDLDILRQTLLFGGLEVMAYNQNRKINDLKIFEFGKTYRKKEGYDKKRGVKNYHEEKHLTFFATGRLAPENWNTPDDRADFFFVKGIADSLLKKLGIDIEELEIREAESPNYQYGLQLLSGEKVLAEIGSVHKDLLKMTGVKNDVFAADFNWDLVISLVPRFDVQYVPVPKFPAVRRDLALVVDKNTRFEALKKLAFKTERKLLKSVGIFDVYEGDKVPEGKKSYALSFVLQDENKTLTDKVIDKTMRRLQQAFEKEAGAVLR